MRKPPPLVGLALVACCFGAGCKKKPSPKQVPGAPSQPAQIARSPDEPPALAAAQYIFEPTFTTNAGVFTAGKAVPVKVSGKAPGVLVVTCDHIFGPLGGLPKEIPASDLPTAVSHAGR